MAIRKGVLKGQIANLKYIRHAVEFEDITFDHPTMVVKDSLLDKVFTSEIVDATKAYRNEIISQINFVLDALQEEIDR